MRLLAQIGLVALGSAVGGLLRWGVSLAAGRWLGTRFPYGTFFINVSGCLFLGWITTILSERLLARGAWLSADDLRLLLAVGFTGAYTTFSTFELETHNLLARDDYLAGLGYLFSSVSVGLVAVYTGIWLARR